MTNDMVSNESHANETFCYYEEANPVHKWLSSQILLGFLYCLVFTTAITGNFLVIYVVATNRAMQTVTNLFITNLAVSDFVVNLTSLWITPLYTYLGKWVWGSTLCHTVPFVQGTSIFISSLTLTAIAVDRFIVILHPFKQRTSSAVCLTVISFIWLVSLMLVAPYAVHMTLTYIDACGVFVCKEEWALAQIQVVYGVIVITLQFGIPFLIITFCYGRIWIFLNYRETTLHHRSDADYRRKRRMLKMLISMVCIFALCWLPTNVVNILKDNGLTSASSFEFTFLLAHVISMSSSMWNPLLYAFLNDNFRREFMAVLPCFRGVNGRLRRAFSISARSGQTPSPAALRIANGLNHTRKTSGRLTVAEHDDFSNIAVALQRTRQKISMGGQTIVLKCSKNENEPLNNNCNYLNDNQQQQQFL